MTNKFVTVMEKIGEDVLKDFEIVVQYLPDAAAVAGLIFPSETAPIAATVTSVDLIQKAVATVEQKFAAVNLASGTGTQKAATVLSIVGPAVTQLLASEGITYNQTQISNLIDAVVAILKVTPAPASTPAPVAATGAPATA